jgi:hypothetical protein
MSDIMGLEISGVRIRISCPDGIEPRNSDPAYKQFLNTSRDMSPADISLNLVVGNLPCTESLPKIFDSNESWVMFHNGTKYYMSFHPPGFPAPVWVAEINHDFTRAAVYCSEDRKMSDPIPNPVCYPFDQVLLMYYLSQKCGILVHAAGIEINQKGYIFAGRSGAGKTTISKQFVSRRFGSMLSDDRVIIRKIDDTFMVFGTPWPGEGGIAVNRGVELDGIFFIAHSDTNRIEEITPVTTAEKLLPVVSVPWYDPEPMKNILDSCDDLIAQIPSSLLHFKPDTEVVDVFAKRAS